jgi:hypothetical protein
MGIVLCPADDDVAGPDISSSHYGFSLFRQWLAQAEGLVLHEMVGFGGNRPWNTAHDPVLQRRTDDVGRLIDVMKYCVEKGIPLDFC